MATSNLLKVGATTTVLVFNVQRRACHFDTTMLALSSSLRDVCAASAAGSAVSNDSGWAQLSYIG